MKKFISIVFLFIFLFNVGGYYLVFWALRSHANQELLHRLDADQYASEDLVVLSIPVTLPYPVSQDGYQRVDGEFEYNGAYFNLVKQKMENDTLFLVCVKNHTKKKLVNTMNEYSNLINNLPTNTKQTTDFFGKLFKDYTSLSSPCLTGGQGWSMNVLFAKLNVIPITKDYPVISPPPKVRSIA